MKRIKNILFFSCMAISGIAFAEADIAGGRIEGKITFGDVKERGPVIVSLIGSSGAKTMSFAIGNAKGSEIKFHLDAIPDGEYKVQAVMRLADKGCIPLDALKSPKEESPDLHPIPCPPFMGDVFGSGSTINIKSDKGAQVEIQCSNLVK